MQTVVKKWFRDKDSGLLDNGTGPDITVLKADLVKCQFLKVGETVEFECHIDNQGLIAKKVRISGKKQQNGQNSGNRSTKPFRFGVMS